MRDPTERLRRVSPLVAAMVCLLLSSAAVSAGSTRYEMERAGLKAAEATENARKAAICRDMGLNAVRNAMAARDKAQEDLIEAIRAGENDAIVSAWEASDAAARRLEDVWSVLRDIVAWVEQAETAATNASMEADVVVKGGGALRRVVNYARESTRCAVKASDAADKLKAEWLVHSAAAVDRSASPDARQP